MKNNNEILICKWIPVLKFFNDLSVETAILLEKEEKRNKSKFLKFLEERYKNNDSN